jgi:uncharacterized membrane protein
MKTIVEYLITLLLFTLLNLAVLVLVFHHTGALTDLFSQYSTFAMHYLCMSVFFAFAIPLIEKFFRSRMNVKILSSIHLNIKTDRLMNICLLVYSGVLIFANYIRCFDNALWGDEAFTARLAKETFADMISQTAADVHPPLYYIFTQIAFHIAGDSGYAYHLVSFLAYLIIIILGLTVVKKEWGKVTASLLITFSSLTEYAVNYNVEIRMYSWAALFVFASYLSCHYILKNNSWRSWVVFVLSSLGAAYTHYYALVMVAVFYLCLILLSIKKKQLRAKITIASIITIAGYLPWFFILLRTFGRTSSSWWLATIPTLEDCFVTVFSYQWLFPVLLVGFILFVLYETGILKIEFPKFREWKAGKVNVLIGDSISMSDELIFTVMGILSALGTVAVGLTMSYAIRPLFLVRYLWPIAPVMYLVLGRIVSKMNFRRVWCVIIIGAFLFNAVPSYCETYQYESTLNKATTEFQANVRLDSSDYIITNSNQHVWTILTYYYPESTVARCISDRTFDVDDADDKNIWIFWTSELSEATLQYYEDEGKSYTLIYQGRLGNDIPLWVYQVERSTEK